MDTGAGRHPRHHWSPHCKVRVRLGSPSPDGGPTSLGFRPCQPARDLGGAGSAPSPFLSAPRLDSGGENRLGSSYLAEETEAGSRSVSGSPAANVFTRQSISPSVSASQNAAKWGSGSCRPPPSRQAARGRTEGTQVPTSAGGSRQAPAPTTPSVSATHPAEPQGPCRAERPDYK